MTLAELALAGSVACSAAFYLMAAVVYVIRRPLTPPTMPATSDLGSESPAVANLLVNGGTVTPDAVPATLLDLAACKFVQIDETEPQTYVCRIGLHEAAGLTRYEARVLDLLRSKAADGTVPAAALTTGPSTEAKSWERKFRGEVIAEARRSGVCAPRWPPQMLTALAIVVVAAFGGVALASNNTDTQSLQWLGGLGLAGITLVVSSKIFRDDTQIVTPAGLQEQARWLSLRKYLHDDELFSSLPPTAVAVRERYLAYGAALGVAAAAVRSMPMGAENDRRAWSHYGGGWHQVTVSYPTFWPPAWGSSPLAAAWTGIKIGVFGLFWLWLSSRILPHIAFGPHADQLTRDLSAGAVVVAAVSLPLIAVGLWLLLAGMVSLLGTSHVTGEAIRLRNVGTDVGSYLAVDPGTSDHVRAWKVRAVLCASLTEYTTVTVSVTPLLGYVRHVQRVATPVAGVGQPAPGAAS